VSTYTGDKIVCINSKWKAESSIRKPAVDKRDWTLSFKIPSFIPVLLRHMYRSMTFFFLLRFVLFAV